MPISFDQTITATGPDIQTVSFAGPTTGGNLLAVVYIGETALTSFFVDGAAPSTLADSASTNAGLSSRIILFAADGTETSFTLQPANDTGAWSATISEISGEAGVEPYTVSTTTGTGDGATDFTFTPATTDDPAVNLMLAATAELATLTPGAGWTELLGDQLSAATFSISYASYPTPGVQAAETWADPPGNGIGYFTRQLVLYEIGRRVNTATVTVLAQGVQLFRAGRVEPPVAVTPALPDLEPLPEDPSPIIVPQPPWVPTPGRPYRRS